jgi:nucleoside-diphosphate kinase
VCALNSSFKNFVASTTPRKAASAIRFVDKIKPMIYFQLLSLVALLCCSLLVCDGHGLSTTSLMTPPLQSADVERTFVAIKPDGVQRNLIGEIIKRFEMKGLKIVGLKIMKPPAELINKHYEEHIGKSFYADMFDFLSSGPIVAIVVEGKNSIHIARKIIGKTQPEDAEPGTIRGDFCFGKGRNLVHASDSVQNAEKEIAMWFGENEILSYTKSVDQWVNMMPSPSMWQQ